MIGLLVTVVLFPLAGWTLGRRSFGEAFLLGLGITGSVLFIAGVVRMPLVIAMVLLLVASVVGVVVTRRPLQLPHLHSPLPTILMAVPLLALTFAAAITPLNDFDGRAFWALKAKGIAHEHSIDGPFFHGGTLDPRNQYPILIPLDGAVILGLAHNLDDRNLRWLYLGILAALALLVRERIGRLVSPAAGAWCAAILVWIPQFAVGAFFELIDEKARKSEIRFGLWLAFLVLTKREGLPFALVLLAIGAFVFRKRIVTPAVITSVATAALLVWRWRIPVGDQEDVLQVLLTVPDKLHRIGMAAFPRHMLLMPRWGIFWIAVIIAAMVAARIDRRAAWLAITVIAALLGIYTAVYITTAWVPSELIAVTADRLLMHVVAPSLFLLALATRRAGG